MSARTLRFALSAAIFGVELGLFASPAGAVQPLQEFLDGARQRNFDARESVATGDQRDAEAGAALGRLLPVFSARGTYTRNQYEVAATLPGRPEPLVITPQNQLDAVLQLDVPLIDLASYHRYRATAATARSARAQTESTRLDVARSVAQAYFTLLGATGVKSAAEHSLEAARDNLRIVDDRVGAGVGTELDRARATASVERARQDQADAELAVALSARRLETLSGVSPTPAGEFPGDALEAEAPLEQFLGRLGRTPSERAALEATKAAEHGKKSADSAFLPTLSALGQERFSNATGFSGRTASYVLQVTAAFRLDYTNFANDDAQAAALEGQRVRTERQRRSAADAVFEAYRRVEAGIAKSRAARAQEAAALRAGELAGERYLAGAATQLDVTEAQRDHFLAQASRLQADADLAYARIALRLAAGLPLAARRAP